MNNAVRILGMAALMVSGAARPGYAGTVTGLVTFTANTPARAAEVNGNFTAVKTAVDDNQALITALTARVAALEAQLTNITALNAYLSLQMVNGHPTVRVTAANLQVVNGAGSTDRINGLGNLIVGYDELRPDDAPFTCSLPVANRIDQESACNDGGGTWARDHKSGSHNLVLGSKNNYSSYAGGVLGTNNAAVAAFATVAGGQNNTAGGPLSIVTGGTLNGAWGLNAAVVGGQNNSATGYGAAVSGGRDNQASGTTAAVLGGQFNVASGSSAAISGGATNQALGQASAVSGGGLNTARGDYSSVSGGYRRSAEALNWAAGTLTSAP